MQVFRRDGAATRECCIFFLVNFIERKVYKWIELNFKFSIVSIVRASLIYWFILVR